MAERTRTNAVNKSPEFSGESITQGKKQSFVDKLKNFSYQEFVDDAQAFASQGGKAIQETIENVLDSKDRRAKSLLGAVDDPDRAMVDKTIRTQGEGLILGADAVGEAFVGAVKTVLPQFAEDAISNKTDEVVTSVAENETVQDVSRVAVDTFQSLPEGLQKPLGTAGILGLGIMDVVGRGAPSKVLDKLTLKLAKETDEAAITKQLSALGDEYLPADKIAEITSKVSKATDQAEVKDILRTAQMETKSGLILQATSGRAPGVDATKVFDNLQKAVGDGAKVGDDGLVDLFVVGSKEALDNAKKTGQLTDLAIATAKAKSIPQGQVASKIQVPIEKLDYDIAGKLTVASDGISLKSLNSPLSKQIDELTGISKSADSKQDLLNFKASINELRAAGSKSGVDKARAIKSVQEALINMVKQLPLRERGKWLSAVKNTTSTNKLEKVAERVIKKQEDFTHLKKELRNKNSIKSNLAYIRKAGEFNQTMVNDAKKSLGITNPISKMTLKELQDLREVFKERLNFKDKKSGYVEARTDKYEMSKSDIEAFANYKGKGVDLSKLYKTPLSYAKRADDAMLKTPNIILSKIDRRLSGSLKRAEMDMRLEFARTGKILDTVNSGVKKKIPKKYRNVFKGAMLNRDKKVLDDMTKRFGIEKEMAMYRELMDQSRKDLNEVGYEVGFLEDYFPNTAKNSKKLREFLNKNDKYSVLTKAIAEKELLLGRKLTDDESAQILNSLLRGFNPSSISLTLSGIDKNRVIHQIDPELASYYKDPLASSFDYLREAIEKKHMARLLGKLGAKDVDTAELGNTIGAITSKLLKEGKITNQQSVDLSNALKARMNTAPTSGWVQGIKNSIYIGLLNDFENALTQLGDFINPITQSGIAPWTRASVKQVFRKNELKAFDVGISNIGDEFNQKGPLTFAVDNLLKVTGLSPLDMIAKTNALQTSVEAARMAVKKGKGRKYNEFLFKAEEVFTPSEVKQLKSELATEEATELVRLYALKDLMDIQPISKSDMPIAYLNHPDGRIFYTLKTWSVRALNRVRESAISNNELGLNKVENALNLTKITAGLVIMGASVDTLKDWIRNKEDEPFDDRVIDNFLQLLFVSRYDTTSFQRDPLGALANKAIPGSSVVRDLIVDIVAAVDPEKESDWKSKKNLPIIGPLLNEKNDFFRTKEGQKDEEEKETSSRTRTRTRSSSSSRSKPEKTSERTRTRTRSRTRDK